MPATPPIFARGSGRRPAAAPGAAPPACASCWRCGQASKVATQQAVCVSPHCTGRGKPDPAYPPTRPSSPFHSHSHQPDPTSPCHPRPPEEQRLPLRRQHPQQRCQLRLERGLQQPVRLVQHQKARPAKRPCQLSVRAEKGCQAARRGDDNVWPAGELLGLGLRGGHGGAEWVSARVAAWESRLGGLDLWQGQRLLTSHGEHGQTPVREGPPKQSPSGAHTTLPQLPALTTISPPLLHTQALQHLSAPTPPACPAHPQQRSP